MLRLCLESDQLYVSIPLTYAELSTLPKTLKSKVASMVKYSLPCVQEDTVIVFRGDKR